MEKPFTSKADFIKLTKQEADILRDGIATEYKKNGGQKILGKASPKIYSDLVDNFKRKFAENEYGISYTDSSGHSHSQVQEPGHSFLRNLLYVNKGKEEEQHHKYQIDLCYLYAFGKLHDEYLQQPNDGKNDSADKLTLNFKIIVSSIAVYAEEVEQVKKKIESSFGYPVEKDIRQRKSLTIGPLAEFYGSPNDNVIIFHLIGKNYLLNEACVNELNKIRTGIAQSFKTNSVVVMLEDICEGDFNLNETSGKHKINELWAKQIKYLDETTIPGIEINFVGMKAKDKKEALEEVNADKKKIKLIMSKMCSLIDFISTEVKSIQYAHLVNHFTNEEFAKLLSCSVPFEQGEKILKLNAKRKKVLSKEKEIKGDVIKKRA